MIHYRETPYGFEWCAAKIERGFSDEAKGWVTLLLTTPKADIQIYITKTGKVRVHNRGQEWKPEAQATKTEQQ